MGGVFLFSCGRFDIIKVRFRVRLVGEGDRVLRFSGLWVVVRIRIVGFWMSK